MNIHDEEYIEDKEEELRSREELFEYNDDVLGSIANKLIFEDMDDFYQNV